MDKDGDQIRHVMRARGPMAPWLYILPVLWEVAKNIKKVIQEEQKMTRKEKNQALFEAGLAIQKISLTTPDVTAIKAPLNELERIILLLGENIKTEEE